MPILLKNVDLELKMLPLTMAADGSATVVARKGYTEDGDFKAFSEVTLYFTKEEVSAVLDTPPVEGLSRRDDLSFAVYQMMVAKGYAEGTIS